MSLHLQLSPLENLNDENIFIALQTLFDKVEYYDANKTHLYTKDKFVESYGKSGKKWYKYVIFDLKYIVSVQVRGEDRTREFSCYQYLDIENNKSLKQIQDQYQYDHIEYYNPQKVYERHEFKRNFDNNNNNHTYRWVLINHEIVAAERVYSEEYLKSIEHMCSCPLCKPMISIFAILSHFFNNIMYSNNNNNINNENCMCKECIGCIKSGPLYVNEKYVKEIESKIKKYVTFSSITQQQQQQQQQQNTEPTKYNNKFVYLNNNNNNNK